jgi:hypothetical protein
VKHGITPRHIFTVHVFSRGQTTYVQSIFFKGKLARVLDVGLVIKMMMMMMMMTTELDFG